MLKLLGQCRRFLHLPLEVWPRALLILAGVLLILCYVFPLWDLTMFAPQYPGGLRLHIYSWKLEGGNGGQDIKEINLLNHYIGMHDLEASEFSEFKWIPFVVGALGLLFFRAAVFGEMKDLVDVLTMYGYFTLFSMWSFAFKLWTYGHNLAPTAAVKVQPFMPPLFGRKQLANFEVYSYPAAGSYALGAVMLILMGGFVLAWRQGRGRTA